MRDYLKVKVLSLAEEAKIIRRLEKRRLKYARKDKKEHKNSDLNYQIYFGLRSHRIFNVRNEARAAHLAYGYLKGLNFQQMEQKTYSNNQPNWNRVKKLVDSYTGPDINKSKLLNYNEWVKGCNLI